MRGHRAGVLVVALLFAACGGDDDEAGQATSTSASVSTTVTTVAATSSTAATTVTTRGGATTTAAPACAASPITGTPADVTTAQGDFDGDRQPDTLRAYRLGQEWHLRVEFGGGGAADTTVTPQGPVAVKAIGPANLGPAAQVALATVGSGASTTIVGLYFVKSCKLQPVVNESSAASFPVGASVGSQSGLECADYGNDGTPNLLWHRATSTDGMTYRATTTIYAFSGESIATVPPGVVGPINIVANDPQFRKYSTLTCGGLSLS